MADNTSVDLARVPGDNPVAASPDLLRAMVQAFAEALMGADADALCGAPYGQPSADRVNYRNGYRQRRWDTRAGTIDLAIPKLRAGSYFPEWLLERKRRAEQALISVVATSYVLGVSTRRVEKLAETLGITSLSKSQVSELAKSLDASVEQFRSRPLDAGPYRFVQADAMTVPGASWQRFRTHYLRDLLTKVAKSSQPWVATLVRTIFDQPDAAEVCAQFDRVVSALDGKLPAAAGHLSAAREDLLAFTAVPREIWRQVWSSNPQERLNRELRRRTDVVGIFPGRDAIIRLVGAVLMEQNDEWTEARRYMGLEILAKIGGTPIPAGTAEEVNAIQAISA